jgi:hypothetical protein
MPHAQALTRVCKAVVDEDVGMGELLALALSRGRAGKFVVDDCGSPKNERVGGSGAGRRSEECKGRNKQTEKLQLN